MCLIGVVRADPNTNYYYWIQAVGLDGSESSLSDSVGIVHLQPDISITGDPVNIDVGYGYTDSTYFTIHNDGNYDLEYSITGAGSGGNVTDGLVAYYQFDETNNDTEIYEGAQGSVGLVNGTIGKKNNVNGSIEFNGTSSYLYPGWSFNDIGTEASWGCWLKTTNAPGSFFASNDGGDRDFHNIIESDGHIRIDLRLSSGNQTLNSTTAINDGLWHHVWINWQQNGIYQLLVDGVLDDDSTYPDNKNNDYLEPWIGAISYGSYGASFFNGEIDEFLIFDRILNPSEVTELFNSGNGKRADECSFIDYIYYNDMDGLNDISGNGNHGKGYNGVTEINGGYNTLGSCMEFDGVDDYIKIPYSTSLNNFQDELTVSLWFYPTDGTTDDGLVYKGTAGVSRSYAFTYQSGEYVGNSINTDSGSGSVGGSTGSEPINNWYHEVIVYDGSVMKVYINNNLEYQTPLTGNILIDNSNLYIGTYSGVEYSYFEYFQGKMDEIRIYNRVLLESEIQFLYDGSSSSYLSYNPTSGIIPGGSSEEIWVTIDAGEMEVGNYSDILDITTNDPLTPLEQVTVNTDVLPPDISVDVDSFEVVLNVESNTSVDYFNIDNDGQGKLEFEIYGNDSFAGIPEITDFTQIGELNGNYYYYSTSQMTWHNAKQACENAEGYLVVISSQEENDFVVHPTETCWIGFTDEEMEGIFKTVLGDTIWTGGLNGQPYQNAYTNWRSDQPDNSGNEDYVHNYPLNSPDAIKWNDFNNINVLYFVLEIDEPNLSILSFIPSSGTIEANGRASQQIEMTTDGSSLDDGIYETAAVILSNDPDTDSLEIPVTVKVDYTEPLQVQNVVFDSCTADIIEISWDANAIDDSVYYYNIYRRNQDETNYLLTGTSTITQYIDYNFTGLDTTFFYYKVSAVDWVDNEGAKSDSIKAWLARFRAPENVTIQMINENKDCLITWDPVTETMSGVPGTPTCYVVYHNDAPTPTSDFLFLATSLDTFYVHQNVGLFVEENQKFYLVTAYGGLLDGLEYIEENNIVVKLGELDKLIEQYYSGKLKATIPRNQGIRSLKVQRR